VSHLVGARDSFNDAYYGKFWGRGYNEPNLSIRQFEKDIFRLSFESAFGNSLVFILTEDNIVIKERKTGSPYPEYDSTKLTDLEKLHYKIFKRYFPLQDTTYSAQLKKRLDSIVEQYPKLLDQSYYRYLLEKSTRSDSEPFTYSTKKVKISKRKFNEIVNLINSSGFWRMPYHNECKYDFADGFGFILEANTPKKYNIVGIACPGDTSDFIKACQEIINAANLEKKIKL